jgi:FixJ family two-component response regulator
MVEGSRVFIVGGDEGTRCALCHLLARAGHDVMTFESAEDFATFAPIIASGCVLATVEAPLADGFAPPAVLNARRPDLPVIVRSAIHGEVALAVQAIKGGAADFLDASSSDEQVTAAVERVLNDLQRQEDEEHGLASTAARIAEMSAPERDVLRGLLAGGTNLTIGKQLGISPRAVEIHRTHMMEHLHAQSLCEAVRMAVAAGLHPAA